MAYNWRKEEEEFGDSFKCFLFFAIFLFSRKKKKLSDLKKKKQFLKIFLHLLVPHSETEKKYHRDRGASTD